MTEASLRNPREPLTRTKHVSFTHKEIAAMLGVCYQRVQQLEKRALRKIKVALLREAKKAGMTPAEYLEATP